MGNEIIVGDWSRFYGSAARRARTKSEQRERTPRKRTQSRYTKPAALVAFEKEYNAAQSLRYSKVPPECRARWTFSDKDANSLTRAIIAHLKFNGYFAARVNTTGLYDQRRGLWRTTSAQRGMADISAVINGRSVQLEIKAGRDRPRADQINVQMQVQAAGGVYEFVHNFTEYIELYNLLAAAAL